MSKSIELKIIPNKPIDPIEGNVHLEFIGRHELYFSFVGSVRYGLVRIPYRRQQRLEIEIPDIGKSETWRDIYSQGSLRKLYEYEIGSTRLDPEEFGSHMYLAKVRGPGVNGTILMDTSQEYIGIREIECTVKLPYIGTKKIRLEKV